VNGLSAQPEFSSLLEHIRFEYLSSGKFEDFIELISNSFDCLTTNVWSSLRSRLALPISPQSSNDRSIIKYSRSLEFIPSSTAPLNGIIAYLTERCGGNVHNRDVVSITASSNGGPRYLETNVADLTSDNDFESQDSPNSWICYDFKTMRIRPTHYSIRSYARGRYHLKHWVVEGLASGDTWIELDRRENDKELNATNVTRTFSVSRPDEIRMIRLRQIGPNHFGSHKIKLSSIKIFGSLIE
jgi:hypothetical protein